MVATVETLSETSWTRSTSKEVDPRQDSGLQSLLEAARSFGIAADARQVRHLQSPRQGVFEELDILRAARRLGLRARAVDVSLKRLRFISPPAIIRDGAEGSFHLLQDVTDTDAGLLSPDGQQSRIPLAEFSRRFSRRVILVSRLPSGTEGEKTFGLDWFLPTVLKHAARFRLVIAVSLVLQVFALASPKLSELVIDRVLVSRGLHSLEVLAIGMLGIALFNPLMEFLRGLIYAHLASCVNAELSSRLFRHLLRLPLSFFVKRQAGEIIARVRELDQVRTFLTGAALMLVLDLSFVGVFDAVMYFYAANLASIVLGSLAIFLLLWMGIGPFLRRFTKQELERQAANTAYLTEAVSGIETVKSLAIGDRLTADWEDRLAAFLKASFRTTMMGNWASGSIGLVQKLTHALLLWFGVHHVLTGDLTVGQLVAFNMLADHVTMPILRLAQIWQDFQHTGVSIKRIGDIMNERPETVMGAGRSSLHGIRGAIELRKVTFRYADTAPEALRRLSLRIEAGEKLGITGRSGSGKSTITKLIQRLDVPQSGQVLVDGVDLALADTAMLRRNMGVVLQESFLFNGSIAENIRLGNPQANVETMERAARLAGAHDFITKELPYAYDTQVGERGGLLSGGQRQRIAIARALVGEPAILIMDEATSALDYESEAAIIERMPEIIAGRTALLITHRLNIMRLCDRIIVLEHGEIVEEGTHEALLQRDGSYAQLWRLQNG